MRAWTILRAELRASGVTPFAAIAAGRDARFVQQVLCRMPDVDRRASSGGSVVLELKPERARLIFRALRFLALRPPRRSAFQSVRVAGVERGVVWELQAGSARSRLLAAIRRQAPVDPRTVAVVVWDRGTGRAVFVDRGAEVAFARVAFFLAGT